MHNDVCLLLRKTGLRGDVRGFHYLAKATLFALNDPSYLFHLTKRLYPDVALANATARQAERSMRTAVALIWS